LQEHEVERLGGRKTIALNVRVLATTNRDLLSYVNEKQFREDLYYRLSVFPLHWKSLAQRPRDILPMAERLLLKHCKKQSKSALIFDIEAQNKLIDHTWPGNVRELDNVIQRALIIQTGHQICADDIVLNLMTGTSPAANQVPTQERVISYDEPISQSPVFNSQVSAIQPPVMSDIDHNQASQQCADALGDNLKQREYVLILDALKNEKNKKRAAEKLGISPRTLRYKMARMREQGIALQGDSLVY